MKKKKILVLGSNGFIGQNILRFLNTKKYDLYGCYLNRKPKINNVIFKKANLLRKAK